MFDADKLLQEISADEPCGGDLEYDSDFMELNRLAQGKPEQQFGSTVIPAEEPDWRSVEKAAVALFSRTKDLRVAMTLAQAATNMHGFEGLGAGLALLRGMVERYWEPMYPRLDPDDDNDPTARVNLLMSLADRTTFLRLLRDAPLVSSRTVGRFGLRQYELASDPPPKPPADMATMTVIDAAFMDADPESLKTTALAIRSAAENTKAIEIQVTDLVGVSNAPNLEELTRVLRDAQKIMGERLQRRGLSIDAAPAAEEAAPEVEAVEQGDGGEAVVTQSAPVSAPGQIATRADVIKTLDRICEYYARYEPSSPVPVLLHRARGLVEKSFVDLLRELAPSGVPQFEVLTGPPAG